MLHRQFSADPGDRRAALATCTKLHSEGRGMTHETIEIQAGLGVAVLWLNRPEVRNAFNETMIAELTAAFSELEQDPAVRAVVLAGRGKVFCAGADLNWMKRMGELDFDENRKDAMAFGTMLKRLHALAKPTVARVHGAAFAGGMGLIAACDIAVASTDTEFCVSEVRLGLTPATISPYVLAAMGERAEGRYGGSHRQCTRVRGRQRRRARDPRDAQARLDAAGDEKGRQEEKIGRVLCSP